MPAFNVVSVDADGWPILSKYEPVLHTISDISVDIKWGDGYPTRSGARTVHGAAFLTDYRLIVIPNESSRNSTHFSLVFPLTYMTISEVSQCDKTKRFGIKRSPTISFTSTPMQNAVSFENSAILEQPAQIPMLGNLQQSSSQAGQGQHHSDDGRYGDVLDNGFHFRDRDHHTLVQNARAAPATTFHINVGHIACPVTGTITVHRNGELLTRPGTIPSSFIDTSLEAYNSAVQALGALKNTLNQQVGEYEESSVSRPLVSEIEESSESSSSVSFARALYICVFRAAEANRLYIAHHGDVQLYGHAASQHTMQNFSTFDFLCEAAGVPKGSAPLPRFPVPSPESQKQVLKQRELDVVKNQPEQREARHVDLALARD